MQGEREYIAMPIGVIDDKKNLYSLHKYNNN